MKLIICFKCRGKGRYISGFVCKYMKKCIICKGKGKVSIQKNKKRI